MMIPSKLASRSRCDRGQQLHFRSSERLDYLMSDKLYCTMNDPSRSIDSNLTLKPPFDISGHHFAFNSNPFGLRSPLRITQTGVPRLIPMRSMLLMIASSSPQIDPLPPTHSKASSLCCATNHSCPDRRCLVHACACTHYHHSFHLYHYLT